MRRDAATAVRGGAPSYLDQFSMPPGLTRTEGLESADMMICHKETLMWGSWNNTGVSGKLGHTLRGSPSPADESSCEPPLSAGSVYGTVPGTTRAVHATMRLRPSTDRKDIIVKVDSRERELEL